MVLVSQSSPVNLKTARAQKTPSKTMTPRIRYILTMAASDDAHGISSVCVVRVSNVCAYRVSGEG